MFQPEHINILTMYSLKQMQSRIYNNYAIQYLSLTSDTISQFNYVHV